MSPSRPWRSLAFAAALLTVVVHLPALNGEWIYDDYPYLVENRDLTGGLDRVPRLFTSSFPSHAPERGLYRPVTALSFRLDRLGGRPIPIVSHAINLALAAALTLAVFGLLRRWVTEGAAAFGALLFAVHPVHVEAFAWVTGRAEILACLCGVVATSLALDVARRERGWGFAVAAGGALLAGLLAKESAVVFLPIAALLVMLDPAARGGARRSIGALGLAVGLALVARLAVLGAIGPGSGETVGPAALADRGPLILAAAGEHLRLLVWPHPLSVDRMVHVPASWGDPRVLLGAGTLGLLVALGASLRRHPRALALVVWPILALGPVLHLVPIGEAVAERFLLPASIGVCGLIGLGLATLAERRRRAAIACLVALGLVGSVLSLQRARDWRWETDLWRRETERSPDSPVAWAALGDSWLRRDWPDRAVESYQQALEIDPGRTAARLAMARAWDQLGRGDRAMEESSTAVHIDPDHPVALNNLGARLARAGRVEEAEKMFRRAVEVSPGYAPALRNAAMAAAQRGDGPEARSLLERARRADPEAPGLDDLAERVRALP